MKPREIVATVIAGVLVVYVLVLASSLFFGTPPGANASSVFDKMIGLLGPIVGFYFGSAPAAAAQEAAAAARSDADGVKRKAALALEGAHAALVRSPHVSTDKELAEALKAVKDIRANIQ
jgi:hypothetical protein